MPNLQMCAATLAHLDDLEHSLSNQQGDGWSRNVIPFNPALIFGTTNNKSSLEIRNFFEEHP